MTVPWWCPLKEVWDVMPTTTNCEPPRRDDGLIDGSEYCCMVEQAWAEREGLA